MTEHTFCPICYASTLETRHIRNFLVIFFGLVIIAPVILSDHSLINILAWAIIFK